MKMKYEKDKDDKWILINGGLMVIASLLLFALIFADLLKYNYLRPLVMLTFIASSVITFVYSKRFFKTNVDNIQFQILYYVSMVVYVMGLATAFLILIGMFIGIYEMIRLG